MSVRTVAAGRLHFGLLNAGAEAGRQFGGCGLMLADPGVEVRVEPASAWAAAGPSGERAMAFAQTVAERLGSAYTRPFLVTVDRCPPEHSGLGTGTQLGLAVAAAVAAACGVGLTTPTLAGLVGRGKRSAIGLHGFDRGGFLVDGGRVGDRIAPLVARHDFPADWRIVLTRRPAADSSWTGSKETAAFARRRPADGTTDRMCRFLLQGLLPAVAEKDFPAFGDAVYEYNRLAGRAFAADQGGEYASPQVAEVVDAVRWLGTSGVGQSSWGPTVFAVSADPSHAAWLAAQLRSKFADAEVIVTAAANHGATVTRPG
jgi:beta-ribofuranosylaminobenzene 5'-phosphate synthase